MPKFALDTNVYVDAIATEETSARLDQFLRIRQAYTYLNAVVVQELRVGVRTPLQITTLRERIVAPFERRQRLLSPSAETYWECGRVLVDLMTHDGLQYPENNRALVNDILLALSCRAHGITLVTRDTDFHRIARFVKGFTHIAPFPN